MRLLSVQTPKAGVVSLSPAHVNTIHQEGNEKPPHKESPSLEKAQGPVSGFCLARN